MYLHLLKSRRFLPIFVVQFLGAFNDNLFKNAFVMLATFKLAKEMGMEVPTIINMIMALFLLPTILLSAISGQLADRFEKARLVRQTKLAEVVIMALAAAGFHYESLWVLLAATFLTGAQSAVFGPLKYGILPNHLKENELLAGSGLIEAGTFAAILIGTILGGLAFKVGVGVDQWVIWAVLGVALVGWAASFLVPPAPPAGEKFRIDPNVWRATKTIILTAKGQTGIWRAMLGLSWFWTVGAIWISFIPTYVSEYIKADNVTATTFVVIFTIGVALGALACQSLQKGEISAKYVPLAGMGISLCTVLFIGIQMASPAGFAFVSIKGVSTSLSLLGLAVSCGIFSVPLYTILQAWSDPAHTSRNIACNNILNGIMMVAGSILVAVLGTVGLAGYPSLLGMAVINIGVSLYIVKIIPESVLHTFFRWLLRRLFRVEIKGMENYRLAGKRKIIIANHVSYLDAGLLAAYMPEVPTFAVNTQIAKSWWMKLPSWLVKLYPLDPMNPMAIKSLTKLVKDEVPVVIFPEGRITTTGRIMKIYQGCGLAAVKADADIIPVQIDGASRSRLSYLKGKIKRQWFPKISLTVFPPTKLGGDRETVDSKLYDLMAGMAFKTSPKDGMLFESLCESAKIHGENTQILGDPLSGSITYRKLIARALTLGPTVAGQSTGPNQGPVGIMMPNSVAAAIVFFALQSQHRCAALLNFSLGPATLAGTCATAGLKNVWTSKKFVEDAKLEETVAALKTSGIQVLFLEEIRRNPALRLRAVAASFRPESLFKKNTKATAGHPAVILFTSGSSGAPKAVVLSHENLLANAWQLLTMVDFNKNDKVFNVLPVFHSFGLTGGTLAPLIGGVPVFMYPSPLHYKIIPELVYQTGATILFGTNTFLNGYSKKAHPYDFYSLRYIFAGAEKVRDDTRKAWAENFGVRILEGYGATECSPALCINTPMLNKQGTVGKFLPGVEWKLDPVPGVTSGGRLGVKGPNIMLGYYLPENPTVLVPPENGWHDTGDIVEIDPEGFVRIIGRAKRFAKVGGEMVSLAAVEDLAAATWNGALCVAIAAPHDTKGEEIILLTESANPERKDILDQARKSGISELWVPKTIIETKIPVLGTGKPDLARIEKEWRKPA